MKRLSILFLLIVILGNHVFAYDFEVNGIYYSIISLPDLSVSVTYGDEDGGYGKNYQGQVSIPETVTFREKIFNVVAISDYAFENSAITQINIPASVISIGNGAFMGSTLLECFLMPESVTAIGTSVFSGCTSLKNVTLSTQLKKIPDYTFNNCNRLESLNIPDNVTFIGDYALQDCDKIQSLIIPNNVTGIGYRCLSGMSALVSLTLGEKCCSLDQYSLYGLSSLKELIILFYDENIYPYGISFDLMPLSSSSPIEHLFLGKPLRYRSGRYPFENITTFKNIEFATSSIPTDFKFYNLKNLESISFGTMKDINKTFVSNEGIRKVYCYSTEPPTFSASSDKKVFSSSTYLEGTLYVPAESIELYKKADGWGNFWNIVAFGNTGNTEDKEKCSRPTITYANGKLFFTCETKEAICHSTITDPDVSSFIGNEIELGATYNICAFASKPNCEDSDVATATLCWIDVEPKTEGISNDVVQIQTRAVLVQSEKGLITISGIDDGTTVFACTINGQQAGTAISHNGYAYIPTNIKPGDIAILKIKDKSFKIIVK